LPSLLPTPCVHVYFHFKNKSKKISIPYFLGLFILDMILNTYIPAVKIVSPFFIAVAKAGLTLTLFFIGAGLSSTVLAAVGFKPLFQGGTMDHYIYRCLICSWLKG
jgi:uncharacterized membrane protein YadS